MTEQEVIALLTLDELPMLLVLVIVLVLEMPLADVSPPPPQAVRGNVPAPSNQRKACRRSEFGCVADWSQVRKSCESPKSWEVSFVWVW
jgi:hypothetical protein